MWTYLDLTLCHPILHSLRCLITLVEHLQNCGASTAYRDYEQPKTDVVQVSDRIVHSYEEKRTGKGQEENSIQIA